VYSMWVLTFSLSSKRVESVYCAFVYEAICKFLLYCF